MSAGKNILTQEMISQANTVYEIRYDFDLSGATINIPENCTLDFQGGSLKNGTINLNKTNITSPLYYIFKCNLKGTIGNDYLNIEWVGAIGDNKTDCTEAFKKSEPFNTKLNKGIYRATNIKISGKRNFIGVSRGDSVLQQINGSSGDFVTLEDWYESLLCNLTINGGSDIINKNYMQALLKFRTTSISEYSSQRSILNNIYICNSEYNGFSILGKDEVDNSIVCNWNWVFTVNNLYIIRCKKYCFYNKSTDNLFSNINCSGGGLANILDCGSSNMFTNLKLDGECCGRVFDSYTLDNYLDKPIGAALIINKGGLEYYINCDIQSSQLQGLKILESNRVYFIGNINNCGLYFNNYINKNNLNYKESWDKVPAIYLKNVRNNNIDCVLDQFDISNQINDFNYEGYCIDNVLKISKKFNWIVNYDNIKLFELINTNTILNYTYNKHKDFKITIPSIIDKDIDDESWYYVTEKSDETLFEHKTFVSTKNKAFEIRKGIKLKDNHVYIALAYCKCIHKDTSDASVYFPYFNIIVSESEDVTEIKEYKSYSKYLIFAQYDKPIANTIKQGDLFFIKSIFRTEKLYDINNTFIRIYSVDNSKYIINNIRLYDLTELLSITDINNSPIKIGTNLKLFEEFIYNAGIYNLDKYFNSIDYNLSKIDTIPYYTNAPKKGTTSQRPTGVQIGYTYKDTDLGKWIIWGGDAWENIDGSPLE